jgi:hypothetical protein
VRAIDARGDEFRSQDARSAVGTAEQPSRPEEAATRNDAAQGPQRVATAVLPIATLDEGAAPDDEEAQVGRVEFEAQSAGISEQQPPHALRGVALDRRQLAARHERPSAHHHLRTSRLRGAGGFRREAEHVVGEQGALLRLERPFEGRHLRAGDAVRDRLDERLARVAEREAAVSEAPRGPVELRRSATVARLAVALDAVQVVQRLGARRLGRGRRLRRAGLGCRGGSRGEDEGEQHATEAPRKTPGQRGLGFAVEVHGRRVPPRAPPQEPPTTRAMDGSGGRSPLRRPAPADLGVSSELDRRADCGHGTQVTARAFVVFRTAAVQKGAVLR